MSRMHPEQSSHSSEVWSNQGETQPTPTQRRRRPSALAGLVALGLVTIACSGSSGNSTGPGGNSGAGGSNAGSSSTGGAGQITGGATSSAGGQSNTTGGNGATGGASTASTTGAATTGGATAANTSATGGSATGGNTASTAATGGNSSGTGGKSSTSTAATGGAATGGKSSTAATGGASSAGGNTSTAGATGTGGSAAGGSTAGGAVIPKPKTIDTMSEYEFVIGNITLDVNPTLGARVTYLKLGTTDIIVPSPCTKWDTSSTATCIINKGITFWTSPQSGWDGTVGGSNVWPPIQAQDGSAYTVTDDGSTSGHLVLSGSADTTLGAKITKDISADSATGWITIKYTITATKAMQVAPWQIARVPRGGLVFFPCSSTPISSPGTTWTLSQTGGYDWIDDKNQTSVSSSDGSKYVVDANSVSGQTYTLLTYALGGNLLLFKYPDVAKASLAPAEGDTEVYPGSGYIELESQGAYQSLAANGTLSWTIQMRVDPIPGSVTVASGNATLSSFAEQQAAL